RRCHMPQVASGLCPRVVARAWWGEDIAQRATDCTGGLPLRKLDGLHLRPLWGGLCRGVQRWPWDRPLSAVGPGARDAAYQQEQRETEQQHSQSSPLGLL